MQDKAWDYSRRAADAAERKFAIVDAAEHLEQALQSARGVEGLPDADVAEALEALGRPARADGRSIPEAAHAYSAARRLLAGDDIAQGRLCFKHSVLEERNGSYPQALRWLRRGMNPLEAAPTSPPLQQRARLIASYGLIRQAQGRRLDAVRWLERAIEAAERANELEALAHAYFVLDWALVELGRGEEAVHSERALELYDAARQARAAGDDLQQPRHVRLARGPLGRGGRAVTTRGGSCVGASATRSTRRPARTTSPRC